MIISEFAQIQTVSALAFVITLFVAQAMLESAISTVRMSVYLHCYICTIYTEYFTCFG